MTERITSEWYHIVGGAPQGTKLAILLFLVMINDLSIDCPTITFVDDITTTETKLLIGTSQMGGSMVKVGDWSNKNHMNVNPIKTKCLFINFSKNIDAFHDLYFKGVCIKIYQKVKLLGLIFQNDLK